MHKFCILPGNNSHLIKPHLFEREVWNDAGEDIEKALEQADFLWKPTNLTRKVWFLIYFYNLKTKIIMLFSQIYSRLNEILQKRVNKPLVFKKKNK